MNDITPRDPRREVVEWLNSERITEQVRRALPDHIPIDWFCRCAQTALLNNPDLATADKGSLLRELVAVAQLGLVMDPQLGEAWLIIDQHKRVQRRVGYQGLRKLALQSGMVTALNAQAVYSNDQCEIDLGDAPHVHHKIDVKLDDRGKPLGCYAVARINGTEMPQVEWMSWKQIEAHRDKYSQAGKRGPWGDPLAEVEMGRKTVFRRLAKWLPKSPLLAEALAHEDRLDMRDVTPSAPELPAPEDRASELSPQIHRTDTPQTPPGRPQSAPEPERRQDSGGAGSHASGQESRSEPPSTAGAGVTVLGKTYERLGAARTALLKAIQHIPDAKLQEIKPDVERLAKTLHLDGRHQFAEEIEERFNERVFAAHQSLGPASEARQEPAATPAPEPAAVKADDYDPEPREEVMPDSSAQSDDNTEAGAAPAAPADDALANAEPDPGQGGFPGLMQD